ncbi:Sphingosine kinase 1 [Glycine max]|nr:Sphingosine kinase 1 [Glycine max]
MDSHGVCRSKRTSSGSWPVGPTSKSRASWRPETDASSAVPLQGSLETTSSLCPPPRNPPGSGAKSLVNSLILSSLLVFVNPFGGKQSAKKIFAEQVKSLLEDAQIQITVQETKHELHAKEVARSLDITKYHGIVCVSGDGILVEVVNGLLQREDWDTAIKMPLGVVPAGNGMAKSLLDSVGDPCEVANAVLAIIRDLVADIDIESEKYRWMGSAWLDFYGLWVCRLLNLRQYIGCVSFVPAPGYEAFGDPTSYPGKSTTSKGSNSDPSEAERANLQRLCYLTGKALVPKSFLNSINLTSSDTDFFF